MKKIVGMSVLFLMVKMSYCAQSLTLASLTMPDSNIDQLDEGSINHLFGKSFQFNNFGYSAFNEIVTRRRNRRMSESSQLASSISGAQADDSDLSHRQEQLFALELALPVMQDQSFVNLLEECSVDEKRAALRVVRSAQVAAQQSGASDTLLKNVRSVYSAARESEGVRQGMVLGGAVLLTSSYAASQNRSIFASAGGGALSMLPELIGGAGSALVAFWAYKKYIGVMEGVRLMNKMQREIGGWVKESKNIKKEFIALKASYNQLKQGVNETIAVTQEVKDHIPSIVALSDDHNTLAGIMQMLIQKSKADEKKIAQLQECLLALAQHGNCSLEVQALLQEENVAPHDGSLPLNEEEQKAEIVKMYNKQPSVLGKLLGRKAKVAVFEDIPQEWFKKHDKELGSAKLTIRP